MNWQTGTFIGLLATMVLGTTFLSYSGAMLPGPNTTDALSLRNVESRRTHFMRSFALGK